MAAISNFVSLAALAPFRVRCHKTRIMFNPVNTEWRLEVFGVACCYVCKAYFTKESELPSAGVSLFNRVMSRSGLDCYLGWWVIRVSGARPGLVVLT